MGKLLLTIFLLWAISLFAEIRPSKFTPHLVALLDSERKISKNQITLVSNTKFADFAYRLPAAAGASLDETINVN